MASQFPLYAGINLLSGASPSDNYLVIDSDFYCLNGFELGVLGLEGVGVVLKEDKVQDDVLVLGCVPVVAQRVGGSPSMTAKPRLAQVSFVDLLVACLNLASPVIQLFSK